MYIVRQLHRKFNRLKLPKRIGIVFVVCSILLLPNFILFSSLEDREEKIVHEELVDLPFTDFSIITLLRGPTSELLKSNPDTYYFEVNSLKSYMRLLPPDRIFAFIDDDAQCPEILQNVGPIRCLEIPCRSKEFDKPRQDCIFDAAQKETHTEIIVFINGDILLLSNFPKTLKKISQKFPSFLAVGKRTDLYIDYANFPIMDLPDSEIAEYAHYNGVPHPEYGLDYFVFTKSHMKSAIPEFPPFIAGAWRWDNWLLGEYLRRKIAPTIDLSNTVTAVHQQSWVGNKPHEQRAGAVFNDELVRNISGYLYRIGFISRTDFWTEEKGAIEIRQKPQSDLLVTLFRRAYPQQRLLLLSSNMAQIDLTRNFLCWTRKQKFENYLILSEDVETAKTLSILGVETYSIASPDNMYSDVVLNYTHTLLYALKQGFHVKIAELATSWDDNFFSQESALIQLPLGSVLSFDASTEDFVKRILRCQAKKYSTDDPSHSLLSNLRTCIIDSKFLSPDDAMAFEQEEAVSEEVMSAMKRVGAHCR